MFPIPGLERGGWETSRTNQGQSSGYHTGRSEEKNMQSVKYLCTADASKHQSNQCNGANDSDNNTFQIVQPPYFSVLSNLVTPGRRLWMQFYFITDQLNKVSFVPRLPPG